jgi:hypothetical protein
LHVGDLVFTRSEFSREALTKLQAAIGRDWYVKGNERPRRPRGTFGNARELATETSSRTRARSVASARATRTSTSMSADVVIGTAGQAIVCWLS